MTEYATPVDRRQRKSRAALRLALTNLVATKPYEAITVEDIVDAADVARATFYAHYRDKTELLIDTTRELVVELQTRVLDVLPQQPSPTGAGLIAVFEHVKTRPDLYRVLISGEGGPAPREELTTAFTDTAARALATFKGTGGQEMRLPMAFVATAFVGSMLAVVESWLGGHIRGTAKQLAVRFLQGQLAGLEWALGFEPGELALPAGLVDA